MKIDINKIKKNIASDNIKIVSFDLFDTLIERNVYKAEDVFEIMLSLSGIEHSEYLLESRINAEKEINDPYSSIYDIWNYIGKKLGLSDDEISRCCEWEIECEKNLIQRRNCGYMLYQYALSCEKKIIVTSDMYLPTEVLEEILVNCGYLEVDKIYVSVDCRARKDNGGLFSYLVDSEQVISPKQVLHIGDNYLSDVIMAKKKGIVAHHIPSNIQILVDCVSFWDEIDKYIRNKALSTRVIFSYIINNIFDNDLVAFNKSSMTIDAFSKLIIFPLILRILLLVNDGKITSSYQNIYFAARDGYLPYMCLKGISDRKKCKPVYFEASRRAVFPASGKDILDRIENKKISNNYTVIDYICSLILDEKCIEYIKEQIETNDEDINIQSNQVEANSIIERYRTIIENDLEEQYYAGKEYYSTIFNGCESRCLIFDCGYSGSISVALSNYMEEVKFDKIYIWDNEVNRQNDVKNGTVTYVLLNERGPFWMDELIECCFSPLSGSCMGFKKENNTINIIHENVQFSEKMCSDIEYIQNVVYKLTQDLYNNEFLLNICRNFNEDFSVKLAELFFVNNRNNNEKIFKNLIVCDRFSKKYIVTMDQYISELNLNYICKFKRMIYRRINKLRWKKKNLQLQEMQS